MDDQRFKPFEVPVGIAQPTTTHVPPQTVEPHQHDCPEEDGDEIWCAMCGEVFKEGERAIFRLVGVVKRGQKSGRYMVDTASGPDEEEPHLLHLHCEQEFLAYVDGGDGEIDELLRFCAGCGAKLNGSED